LNLQLILYFSQCTFHFSDYILHHHLWSRLLLANQSSSVVSCPGQKTSFGCPVPSHLGSGPGPSRSPRSNQCVPLLFIFQLLSHPLRSNLRFLPPKLNEACSLYLQHSLNLNLKSNLSNALASQLQWLPCKWASTWLRWVVVAVVEVPSRTFIENASANIWTTKTVT